MNETKLQTLDDLHHLLLLASHNGTLDVVTEYTSDERTANDFCDAINTARICERKEYETK